MQIYLDAWNPEYVSSLQAETPEEAPSPQIKMDVEKADWGPLKPEISPTDFIFVDGVRRVEDRVILQNGKILYGIFGSVAAGAVLMKRDRLNLIEESLTEKVIERYFITGGGSLPFESPVEIQRKLLFAPVSVPDEGAQAPGLKLQQLMRDAEGKVIKQVCDRKGESILVADGPLHFPWAKQTRAVGYIKSFHEWYLPLPNIQGLGNLCSGERTPLFLIHGQGSQFPDRFSWFVRLSKPEEGDSPLSGLARLEAASDIGIENACQVADQSCMLCLFVSKKYRDPRSPQNLVPIGALEKILKHLLGDSLILQRWIRSWIREIQKRQ